MARLRIDFADPYIQHAMFAPNSVNRPGNSSDTATCCVLRCGRPKRVRSVPGMGPRLFSNRILESPQTTERTRVSILGNVHSLSVPVSVHRTSLSRWAWVKQVNRGISSAVTVAPAFESATMLVGSPASFRTGILGARVGGWSNAKPVPQAPGDHFEEPRHAKDGRRERSGLRSRFSPRESALGVRSWVGAGGGFPGDRRKSPPVIERSDPAREEVSIHLPPAKPASLSVDRPVRFHTARVKSRIGVSRARGHRVPRG